MSKEQAKGDPFKKEVMWTVWKRNGWKEQWDEFEWGCGWLR